MDNSECERTTRFCLDHPVGVVDVTIYEMLPDGKGIRTLGLANFPLANLPHIVEALIDLVKDAEVEDQNV